MAFQKSVRTAITSGVAGEITHDVPTVVVSKVIQSTLGSDQIHNRFGHAFQQKLGAGNDDVVDINPSATGTSFAGILINPKEHVNTGNSTSPDRFEDIDNPATGTLGQQIDLPNGTVASFMRTGVFLGFLEDNAEQGYEVYYFGKGSPNGNDGSLAAFPAGQQKDKEHIANPDYDPTMAPAMDNQPIIVNSEYNSDLVRLPNGEVRYARVSGVPETDGQGAYAWIYVDG